LKKYLVLALLFSAGFARAESIEIRPVIVLDPILVTAEAPEAPVVDADTDAEDSGVILSSNGIVSNPVESISDEHSSLKAQ
jgi:hypothetical protein